MAGRSIEGPEAGVSSVAPVESGEVAPLSSHCRRRPQDVGNGKYDPQQPMVTLAPEGCAVATRILSGAFGPWSGYPGPARQARRDERAEQSIPVTSRCTEAEAQRAYGQAFCAFTVPVS
jgi:hypothetical protein